MPFVVDGATNPVDIAASFAGTYGKLYNQNYCYRNLSNIISHSPASSRTITQAAVREAFAKLKTGKTELSMVK